jgi:predicted site-specific integrase-resolvase
MELMKPEEVAEAIGIPKSTLYGWWTKGDGPEPRLLPSGKRVVLREDLEDWMRNLPSAGRAA